MMQEHVMGGYAGQMNPYGIAAAMNNQQVMANQQAMQARRYS
jgi:ATF/CREB family transcription factor